MSEESKPQKESPSVTPDAPGEDTPKASQEPSAPPEKPLTKDERDARILAELWLPAALHGIVNMPEVGPTGARLFVEQFIKSAAKPDDPIDQLVVQQILLIHYRLISLNLNASKVQSLEGAKVLNTAVARLTAEFRRLYVALNHCRTPAGGKSVAFIKQQNVAQNQDVEFNQHSKSKKKKISRRSKLEDKPDYGGRFAEQNQGSSSGRSRKEAAAVEC